MKLEFIGIVAGVIAAMLLSGCLGSTPGAGPTGGGGGGFGLGAAQSVGGQITLENGLKLSLRDVVTADCASGHCIAMHLIIENTGSSPAALLGNGITTGYRLVESNGTEHEPVNCALLENINPLNPYSPGAVRDGYICYTEPGSNFKFYLGSTGAQAPPYFEVSVSQISRLEKRVALEIHRNYTYAGDTSYAHLCISEAWFTVTNQGTMPVAISVVHHGGFGPIGRDHVEATLAVNQSITSSLARGSDCYNAYFGDAGGNLTLSVMDTKTGAELVNQTLEITPCGTDGKSCCPSSVCVSTAMCSGGNCVACGHRNEACCMDRPQKCNSQRIWNACDPSNSTCVLCGVAGALCCEPNTMSDPATSDTERRCFRSTCTDGFCR